MYASATPANSQASLEAEANGKPHHRLITTTPGDLNTLHGYFAKKELLDQAAVFMEEMYDWNTEKIKDYIEKNSSNNFVYIEFKYNELGRDQAWFENQCRELNNDWFKIKREILLEWTKSSDLSPFQEEQLEALEKLVKEPIAKLFIRNVYPFLCYEDFDFHQKVIIGIDPAGGLAKDNTAITICSGTNLHVLADFENNKIDVTELMAIIKELCMYFPSGPIVIERNNYGLPLLQMLMKDPIIEKRLYYEYKTTKAEKRIKDVKSKSSSTTRTKVYGFDTTAVSRGQMMDILFDFVNMPYEGVNSKRIVRDISGLERGKSGKIEHSETSHDDSLMSWLFIQWVWNFGTTLNKFFIQKKDARKINSDGDYETNSDTEREQLYSLMTIAKMNSVETQESVVNNINYINNNNIIEQFMEETRMQQEFDNMMAGRDSSRNSMANFLRNINK